MLMEKFQKLFLKNYWKKQKLEYFFSVYVLHRYIKQYIV